PHWQPATDGGYVAARRKNSTSAGPVPARAPRPGQLLTQHTGLPPRDTGSGPDSAGAGMRRARTVKR
ncbi:MAG: hypothetical protein ABIX12_06730, partial [Rubrivivax sp.]